MVRSCYISACRQKFPLPTPDVATDEKISYHQLPKNTATLKKWLLAIGGHDDIQPKSTFLVCSRHFTPNDYKTSGWSSVLKLKTNAVPSIGLEKNDTCDEDFKREEKEDEHETDKCRICWSKKGVFFNLDDTISIEKDKRATKVVDLIAYSTGINLVLFPNNEYEHVCYKCLEAIKGAFKFKQRLETSEMILKSKLIEKNDNKYAVDSHRSETYDEKDVVDGVVDEVSSEILVKRPHGEESNENQEDVKATAVREILPNSTFSCHCGKVFKKRINLYHHKRLAHSTKRHECTECANVYKSAESLKRHRNAAHTHKKFCMCAVCGKKFFDASHLRTHSRVHTGERPYQCGHCGKAFTQSPHLRTHIMGVHGSERNYACAFCDKRFKLKDNLKIHERSHTGEKPFECGMCQFKSSTRPGLKIHLQHVHQVVGGDGHVFKCHKCQMEFKRLDPLLIHITDEHKTNANTDDPQTLQCPFCSRACSDIPEMRAHVLDEHKQYTWPSLIQSKRVHQCLECHKEFASKLNLQHHMKNVHSTMTFLCNECGKTFKSSIYLKVHSVVHSNVRKFTCDTCKKTFARQGEFKQHMRYHTGERPYKCDKCGARFIQHAHLTSHMRKHDGLKLYECTTCHKPFAHKGNLTVHMRHHTGETPHACKACGKGFYDSSSCKKHERTHVKD